MRRLHRVKTEIDNQVLGLQIPGTRQTGGVQGHSNLPPEFHQTTHCSGPKNNQVSGPINMGLHP